MRLFTSVLNILYKIEHTGTLSSIPNIPPMLAPTVTATMTQMPGRPTEFPTTLG